jgi:hypothetical protein
MKLHQTSGDLFSGGCFCPLHGFFLPPQICYELQRTQLIPLPASDQPMHVLSARESRNFLRLLSYLPPNASFFARLRLMLVNSLKFRHPDTEVVFGIVRAVLTCSLLQLLPVVHSPYIKSIAVTDAVCRPGSVRHCPAASDWRNVSAMCESNSCAPETWPLNACRPGPDF